MEAGSICRLCFTTCSNFKSIEKTYRNTLKLILPTLNLELSTDPVVCADCSEILQKYITFKTMASEVKNVPNIKDMCLFCKNPANMITFFFLNSPDMDICLLETMLEQYFPELDLQVNTDIFIICSLCRNNVQNIFEFLVNWLMVEQHIEKYCKNISMVDKNEVDLKQVLHYKEAAVQSEETANTNSSIKQLDTAEGIKQESSEHIGEYYITEKNEKIFIPIAGVNEIDGFVGNLKVKLEVLGKEEISQVEFKSTETYNENDDVVRIKVVQDVKNELELSNGSHKRTERDRYADEAVKIELEAVAAEVSNTDVHIGPVKEQVGTERNIDVKDIKCNDFDDLQEGLSNDEMEYFSTGHPVQDTIEKVVRWANCQSTKVPKAKKIKGMLVNRQLIKINCHFCSFETTNMNELVAHMLTHPERRIYQCQRCPYSTTTKEDLQEHSVVHKTSTDMDVFECHTCGFKTCSKPALELHIERCYKSCDNSECQATNYTREEKLQIVMWYHNGVSERQIQISFANMFRNRPIPVRPTIRRIMKNIAMYGCLSPTRHRRNKPPRPVSPEREQRNAMICDSLEQDPTQSTLHLSRKFGLSRATIARILNTYGYRYDKLNRGDDINQ